LGSWWGKGCWLATPPPRPPIGSGLAQDEIDLQKILWTAQKLSQKSAPAAPIIAFFLPISLSLCASPVLQSRHIVEKINTNRRIEEGNGVTKIRDTQKQRDTSCVRMCADIFGLNKSKQRCYLSCPNETVISCEIGAKRGRQGRLPLIFARKKWFFTQI